jgi:hypothetical protein
VGVGGGRYSSGPALVAPNAPPRVECRRVAPPDAVPTMSRLTAKRALCLV